ncbi:MAG: hypothetical protein PHF24_09775 [Syntrophomonas sp.]|nr:hypothetical protein [Syntrophomonas sp.]
MKRVIFWMTIFIIGALIGAALTSVLIGNQVDALYIENTSLQDNLLVADKQIQQLQKATQSLKKRVISNIITYVSFAEESDYTEFEKSTIELSVEKNVREWLGIISGQAVDEVNCQLVPGIIDGREMEIAGQKLRLEVKLVVISETVSIYLEVKPLKIVT